MGDGRKKEDGTEFGIKKGAKKLISYLGIIVVFVATGLYIIADKVFGPTPEIYKHAVCIVIGGYIIVFLAAICVNVIFKVHSPSKGIYKKTVDVFQEGIDKIDGTTNNIKDISSKIDNISEDLKMYVTELKKGNKLLQHILDNDNVVELEESVGNKKNGHNDLEIYIHSSTFLLEKSELAESILWNLRKGIKYIYMIPESQKNEYIKMLRRWYLDFSMFLQSEEKYLEFNEHYSNSILKRYTTKWSTEYQELWNDVKDFWDKGNQNVSLNELKTRCQNIFKRGILTHIEDDNAFFVTVALYEISENNWEVILKLPTQDLDNDYYAFKVPKGEEKRAFIKQFRAFFKDVEYKKGDMSTYGGRYEIDFENDIFSIG